MTPKRADYIPEGASERLVPEADAALYLSEDMNFGEYSEYRAVTFYAVGFAGKAQRPEFNYAFESAEAREEWLAAWLAPRGREVTPAPPTFQESAPETTIEKSSTPTIVDRTSEEEASGTGYTLMGPNLSGGSSSTTPTNPEPLAESQIACSTTAQRSEAATPSESKSKEEESHKLRSRRIADDLVAALNRIPPEGTDTP